LITDAVSGEDASDEVGAVPRGVEDAGVVIVNRGEGRA
jgi:hypothetical protein